jgi:hypothetical protein
MASLLVSAESEDEDAGTGQLHDSSDNSSSDNSDHSDSMGRMLKNSVK